MGLRDAVAARMARQLGHPRGLPGRAIGSMLNKGNRAAVTAAVAALGLRAGEAAADLGFGGGAGLGLLLDRVGPTGQVNGVEISTVMLASAARRYRAARTAGRLHLHPGSLTDLPLGTGSIDAAMTVNTIYFVADLDRALGELARVLAPGGSLIVGLGDPAAMAAMPFTAYGFQLRPVEDVTAAATAAGLTVRDHRRVGTGDHAFHLLLAGR